MKRTEWSNADGSRPNRTTRRDIDGRIAQIGAQQKQLMRIEQLEALGLGQRGAAHRVQARRLFRVHGGVFCLHPPPYSRHQLYLAAVYACGRGTFISDLAAAWLLGAAESAPALPVVTNRTGAGRKVEGIEVHRRIVEPRDVFKRHGIACTRPERTVLDCAASVTVERLEELLMAMDSGRPGLSRGRLEQLVNDNGGHRGIRNLRELISDDSKDTDAENERRMLRICRRFDVPEPETQYVIHTAGRTFRADFCWPELRLIVECDSWRWHGGKLKAERDKDRDQLLTIAGWLVVHFTRNQIKLLPERTGERLAALIAARR